MKNSMKLFCLAIALGLSSMCWGWNCPSGQIRQQAPAGTPTTTPYYDVVEGIAFICVPTPTSVTPTGTNNTLNNTNTLSNTNTAVNTNTNTNTANSSSNSTSTATSNQTQQQKQNQSQVATGGNSTSNAQGGNAVATGNGDNSNNTTVEAPKIPVASAYAPTVLPSAPCIKGFSGGIQMPQFGISGGGGKIDEGCDIRETARSFSGISKLAQCKLLVNEKQSKKAGITVEDCMGTPVVPQQPRPAAVAEPVAPVVIVTVAPIVLETHVEMPVAPKTAKRKPVHHMRPDCQNVVVRVCK